jgi:hypothetical protein
VSCLVRDPSKASIISKAYPAARTVIGDLDSTDLIEKEAEKADIVLRSCILYPSLLRTKHSCRSRKYEA